MFGGCFDWICAKALYDIGSDDNNNNSNNDDTDNVSPINTIDNERICKWRANLFT
jgi:hypothetical protein